MTDKKLTIIVPTYNVEKYIKTSIESILHQSYRDYCIYIVDDASTDDTVKIIKENYKDELHSNKIALLEMEANFGPATARQKAIDKVTTPYITFMDADDVYYTETALSDIMNAAENTRADMIMWKYVTNHGGVRIRKNYHVANNLMDTKEAFIEKVSSNNPIWHYVWNKLYKTSIIRDNNITFIQGLKSAEDVYFNENIFIHFSHIYFLDQYLYLYNCTNTSSLTSRGRMTRTKEEVLKHWKRECDDYDRQISSFCIPLNCLQECERHLQFKLCRAFISQLNLINDKLLSETIKNELLCTEHGQLIKSIYGDVERQLQMAAFKSKIRYFIKKIL